MKMVDRDSAECQNWEKKDKMVIFEIVKLEKDKLTYSVVSPDQKEAKKCEKVEEGCSRFRFVFPVRETETSL